jgi:hypothetical protein
MLHTDERKHKLGCDEYHAHEAPRCCDRACWCRAEPVTVEATSAAEPPTMHICQTVSTRPHVCTRCLGTVDCGDFFRNDHACGPCASRDSTPHPLRSTDGSFFPAQPGDAPERANQHVRAAERVCCGQCRGESRYNGVDNDRLCTCSTDCAASWAAAG